MVRPPLPYRQIAAHLKRGGLIAYPTESCYGLGCDPNNRAAVQRILKLKQRPQHKGLILIASSYQQIARYLLPLTHPEQQQLKTAGQQVVTYLMPARPSTPRWLRGKHPRLAIRMTAFAPAKQLCAQLNTALVSTSANYSGQISAKTYRHCCQLFGKQALILPGKTGGRKRPSTIKIWGQEQILRA